MKPSAISRKPLLALVLFCLASCGEQENNKTSVASATDTTHASPEAATPPPRSTVITTPHNMITAIHKVANYNKWQKSYDTYDSLRLANGLRNYVIGRGLKDSNMVLVAVRVDDLDRAKAFEKSPSLKQAMKKGGVTGAPRIAFTTQEYQDTGLINTEFRSRTTFMVKDWSAWKKSFESHRQRRMDNGIVDRAYGHDADNDHKVTVVVALTDTAKAFAYWKSDQMKKALEESGVASQPERFIYRVVKRY